MFEFLKPIAVGLVKAIKSESIEFVIFIKEKRGKKTMVKILYSFNSSNLFSYYLNRTNI